MDFDFHEHYLSDPRWREFACRYVPAEFHHLFDKYPCSLINAAESYKSGERPFDKWYEYTDIHVWYVDNPKFVHLRFKDGELFTDNLHRKPEIADCLRINIDDFWAYVQVGSDVIIDRLDGIPLPDMLTGKVTS